MTAFVDTYLIYSRVTKCQIPTKLFKTKLTLTTCFCLTLLKLVNTKGFFFVFAICNIFLSIFIYEIINIKHQFSLIILLIMSVLVEEKKNFLGKDEMIKRLNVWEANNVAQNNRE